MRLKVIKKLVDINILYSSKEANLANLRKKQAKNPDKKVDVSGKLLRSYLASSLLLLIQLLSLHFTMSFMRVRTWPPIVPMPLKNQRL